VPIRPFAEPLKLPAASAGDEYYAERSGNRWVSESTATRRGKEPT